MNEQEIIDTIQTTIEWNNWQKKWEHNSNKDSQMVKELANKIISICNLEAQNIKLKTYEEIITKSNFAPFIKKTTKKVNK